MRSVLLILNVVAGYALLRGYPDFWHPIIRVCLAVSALVIAFGLWGRAAKPTSILASPARNPHLLDYLTVGIAVLLVECFFLVFLSLAPSKSEELATSLDKTLHEKLYGELTKNPGEIDAPGIPGIPGTSGSYISGWLGSGLGPRSLNKNDKVRPSNRPEVYLFPKSPADAQQLLATERFLRNVTLATYKGGTWFPLATIPRTLSAENSLIKVSRPHPGKSITYEISHQTNSNGQTLAVTIPDFTSIKQPTLRETAPDTFRLPAASAESNSFRYQATSLPFSFDKISTPVTAGSSPAPEYLTLPEEPILRAKIQNLATSFGLPSRNSLLKLRQTLRTRFQYSLEISLPDEADPLDSFLFKNRIGYCTHFATATAILTRAMGFPSRIAFGWSGGRYFKGPNLFVFRAREAHAWAEIYLKDHGWVIFETTPPSRDEGTASVADPDELPPLEDFKNGMTPSDSKSDLEPLLKGATWLGIAAAIALIVALILRRPAIATSAQSPALNFLPDPPHYLSAFRQACQAHGLPMPPGRTLRAHLQAITAPGFTQELLHYHYAVQYNDEPRNRSTEKKLLNQLRTWEKEIS
ncbi:MAG: transglutaminase-like domain-containing protein [Akkermansiaceae bacterium]|nr:transglutaminase-like domain-containing protein [Akkermansiaceae bacterium]